MTPLRDTKRFTLAAPQSATMRAAFVALRIGLFVLAGWALQRELGGLDGGELLQQLRRYGLRHLALGLSCMLGSFLTLGGIELLALRYAGVSRDIPRRSALLTAFVTHAFSQSIGLALLTGAAVRLRGYARYAVDAVSVARISTFVTLTVTLGLLVTGAGALLASSAPLAVAHSSVPTRPVGLMLLLLVLLYLTWSIVGRRDALGRGRWRIERPAASLAVWQLAAAATDWLLTGTILYAFLPAWAGVGYAELLRVYLIAQTVGVASHVPGGAGVFEVVVLALIAGTAAANAAMVASLVMFRVVYYLLPLVVAGAVAAVAELRPRRARRMAHGVPPASKLRFARARSGHVD